MLPLFRLLVPVSCLGVLVLSPVPSQSQGRGAPPTHKEHPTDAPTLAAQRIPNAPPTPPIGQGPYVSVQVNVDANGANIPGDAGNEPSIAVDPTNPDRIAIGWRQFDAVASNFRQAGRGYSDDGGETWTNPGVLTPGVFRSDPVLESDAAGVFFYNSLTTVTGNYTCDVFRSSNGGATWSAPVYAYGGDKAWMAIDRTGGVGDGNIYCAWDLYGCCGNDTFNRSTNGGVSFSAPVAVPNVPQWGTLAVGPDGELYVAGIDIFDYTAFWVAKSTNAKNPAVTPTFDFSRRVDMGGTFQFGADPNPDGLLGEVWIQVDHSNGPTRGWVYLLSSVNPPGSDPCDVRFARSTDGGLTWSPSIRVNADPPGSNRWQWFGTLGCAPNGRLDAVWNDTSHSNQANLSELFYSFSVDGGTSWSKAVTVTPMWNSHLGWPNQLKIGDYYDINSDVNAAHVAYSATFNGEQDVYYVRIGN